MTLPRLATFGPVILSYRISALNDFAQAVTAACNRSLAMEGSPCHVPRPGRTNRHSQRDLRTAFCETVTTAGRALMFGGVQPPLDDFAASPLHGLGWHSPFGLLFLRLLGFPISMLFAVCHDLLLRPPRSSEALSGSHVPTVPHSGFSQLWGPRRNAALEGSSLLFLRQGLQVHGCRKKLAAGVINRDLASEVPDLLSLPPILGCLVVAWGIHGPPLFRVIRLPTHVGGLSFTFSKGV